jgi:hypothetical protein
MANDYIYLSHKYGVFLNWFQAGGGNISVKENNILYIKQSGTAVCDAKYVKCNIDKLLSSDSDNFKEAVINDSDGIPSIEVWFHTFTKKYTIHMHPCELATILCNDEKYNYLTIPYINPGRQLADIIKEQYNNDAIILLLNHGIIFTSDSLIELHSIIINILRPNESIFSLQDIIGNNIIWKSKSSFNIGKINIYIPDIVIYLGHEIVKGNIESINKYMHKYNKYPVLINYNDALYIIAATKKKYYDIEEMLESYSIFEKNGKYTIQQKNIEILTNWDREMYRQSLQ